MCSSSQCICPAAVRPIEGRVCDHHLDAAAAAVRPIEGRVCVQLVCVLKAVCVFDLCVC